MALTLKNIIIEFSRNKNYFSILQLKKYLSSHKYNYADASVKKYLKELVDEKIIFDAGRSYYSTIANKLVIDSAFISPLIESVKQKFPLLKFSVWSTKQINFAFHHLQNKFFTFIYADKDSLIYLRDHLLDNGYSVFLNPLKDDSVKIVFTQENSVVLRNFVDHTLSNSNAAPIEKILVDLLFESERLNFIDASEYSRVFEHLIGNYRLNISSLLDYAERRKILTKIEQFLIKYTNPTIL